MREALLLLSTLPLLAGCTEAFGTRDAHQPGDPLGTFHITATQTKNQCGDGALGAPATWDFDVKLAWKDGSLFWNSGGEVISGPLSADNKSFQIDTDVVMNMRTATDKGKPACSMDRHDTAKGTLTLDGDGVSAAAGTLTYAFEPTEGSSCDDLVTSDTPLFEAIPCEMVYAFKAPRTGE